MTALGDYLKELRRERALTLKEASARIGMSLAHLNFLERGVGPRGIEVRPTLAMLDRIAEGYGIPVSELQVRARYLPEDMVYLSRPEFAFARQWLQTASREDVALFTSLMRKIDSDLQIRKHSQSKESAEGKGNLPDE